MAISQVASSTPELSQLAPRVLECIAQDSDIDRAVLILYDELGEDGPESMSVIAVYDPLTGGERIVKEHHFVPLFLEAEVIADTFFLQQAAHEVEV